MDHRDTVPVTGHGPRGRGIVLAAFYLFAAVMFTGWVEGWWDHNPHVAAPATVQTNHG